MTVPAWMLLGFAAWTAFLLMMTVGVYRWSLILTGRAPIASFRADGSDGAGWYLRATRAHANCLENLPIFGAIVLVLYMGHVSGSLVDTLAIAVLVARILQSLTHVFFAQSNAVVAIRFTFFSVQLVCFLWLIGIVVVRHPS
jgi:uncharacterized MAPEG superfamily protein